MFFTLIIPANNCYETINRALESIVNQNFDDLKTIIIDDSIEQFPNLKEYINPYKQKINIDYYPRRNDLYKYHCASNTRHDGLRRAFEEQTEYIFFLDSDDELLPNSLQMIYQFLKGNNFPDELQAPYIAYYNNSYQYSSLNSTTLLGKFYKKSFLIKNQLQFKIDLKTHEDIYFSTLIAIYLIKENLIPYSIETPIYKYYIRENSTSHILTTLTGDSLLEAQFFNYLIAAFEPIFDIIEKYPDKKGIYVIHIVNTLTISYLYFQSCLVNGNPKYFKQNYQYYKDFLLKTLQKFNLTQSLIISLAYNNPDFFEKNRLQAQDIFGSFIETQSFKDFINDINFYQ